MNQLRAAAKSPAPPQQQTEQQQQPSVPPVHPPNSAPDIDEHKQQLAEEAERRKKEREQQRKEMRQKMHHDRMAKHRSASKGDNFKIEILESPHKYKPPVQPKPSNPINPPAEPKNKPSNDDSKDNNDDFDDDFEEPEPVPIPPPSEIPRVETPPFYRSKSVPSLSPKKHSPKKDNVNSEVNTTDEDEATSSSSSSSSSESSESTGLVNTFVNVDILQKDIALPHKTSYIPNTMQIGDSDDEESVEEIKEESKNEVIESEEEKKGDEESKFSEENDDDLSDSLDKLAPEDLAEAEQDMQEMMTIMQGILENKNDVKIHSDDDEDDENVEINDNIFNEDDNNNGENVPITESENETKEDKMHIFGVTINPSVLKRYVSDTSNAQSDYYRIEALRIYLEKELGDDVDILYYYLLSYNLLLLLFYRDSLKLIDY